MVPPPATDLGFLRAPALLAALVLAVFAAYQPAWRGEFIWDDDAHVTRPELQSLEGLARIWTEPGATQQYYPVLHTAFWLEHRLFGDSPGGYHATNLALHAFNAWLVSLLLARLGLRGGWLAAVIFALHPVMVESVAWITELKNVLSVAFYLLAALTWLRFDEERNGRTYALSFALFVLALGSKTVTATLPAALLVVQWWRRGSLSWRRDVMPFVPFFVLGVGAGLYTAWFERELIGASGAAFELSIVERLLVAGRVVWFYLGRLFWPAELMFIYPRWGIDAAVGWQFLFPLAALVVLAGLWMLRGRTRGPLAGALFFGGTLFPVLGFFNVYPFLFSYVADHFQYLASLGVIVPLSVCVVRVAPRVPVRIAVSAAAVLCLALGLCTFRQSQLYAGPEKLYRRTIAANPDCWMARINLGTWLMEKRRTAEAIGEFEAAVTQRPDFAKAHYDLGTALVLQGRVTDAMREFEEAIRLAPGYARAHHNLGSALARSGRTAEAQAHFAEAVRLRPGFVEARLNLAGTLLEQGRPREALPHLEEALRLRPGDQRTAALIERVRADLALAPQP